MTSRRSCLAVLAGCLVGMAWTAYRAEAGAGGLTFDEALIPRFNIPKMASPPKIDGTIDPAEWATATKVMGMVFTGGLDYKDRPVSFWLAWDEQHLYLAYRVDILTGKIPHLRNIYREPYSVGVVRDDAIEVGVFLHDRNRKANEVSSYLKFIINSLGAGEYMKNYPDIGQVMFNWTPTFDVANRTFTDAAGKHWWEMEIAMDQEDLQMPGPHKAGDKVDIGLFADVKNPGWQWLDFPSASGHLEHFGFPRGVLTEKAPYVQVEEVAGLHDERLAFRSVVFNPSDKPVRVAAGLALRQGPRVAGRQWGAVEAPETILDEKRTLEIPAGGQARFDVAKAFPGLPPAKGQGVGFFEVALRPEGDAGAPPVYTFACNFRGTDKSYLTPTEYVPKLDAEIGFNPANGRLSVAVDTLEAPIPEGSAAAGATYRVRLGAQTVAEGKLRYFTNQWYDDLVELGTVAPGKYTVKLALIDADGAVLAETERPFEKVNEAEMYPKWWGNRIGNPEQLLQPFEALRVREGRGSRVEMSCTRRVYALGSLGLPVQIEANGGPVLAAPARIVLKVGGKEYTVPTDGKVTVTGQEDWRVDFECPSVTVAGVTFSATGWMEQDGLVELALTYGPGGTAASRSADGGAAVPPIEIEELRVEWPLVEDPLGAYMGCMGQGGNYSARTIGAVPKGEGEVWNTRDDIGKTGSGRRAGNFVGNLWVGAEQRGLFWCADSDKGWEPDERVAALAVKRVISDQSSVISGSPKKTDNRSPITDHSSVVMVNNLIGSAEGKAPFSLTAPRTVRFGYNASPFRHLAPGWRLNQRSAAGSFSGGKYKVNWDNGQESFSVLSPPFSDPTRWPEYYAHCREMAHKLMYEGMSWKLEPSPGGSAYYTPFNRLVFYTCNQIALRGYTWKSIENPNPYATFYGDWVGANANETLSRTYRDYMVWLMDKQAKEGGCQHFYFDISFGEVLFRDLAAGFGYRLADGSIQPESADTNLREWYKRVQAMMQENNLYPGAVSGHATHGFSLKMFPFADCLLDAEYPMRDAIDVFTSEAMIAMRCPHAFGVNVQHLQNFMNPHWANMHDGVVGGTGSSLFDRPAIRHWGISRTDEEFIPYWRNQAVVRELAPGLIASIWRRPAAGGSGQTGSAVIMIMNHGPDAAGKERSRAAALTLDLRALGVPASAIRAGDESVRIRQIVNEPAQAYFLGHLDWVKALGSRHQLPPIEPGLDPASGRIDGFEIPYHHVQVLALDWETQPINDAQWHELAANADVRAKALDWGINGATRLAAGEVARLIKCDNPAVTVQAWRRAGCPDGRGNSVLLRLVNIGEGATSGTLGLDLAGLGLNVRKIWSDYAAAVSLDGEAVENRESADQQRYAPVSYNAYAGELYCGLGKGQVRVLTLDRY